MGAKAGAAQLVTPARILRGGVVACRSAVPWPAAEGWGEPPDALDLRKRARRPWPGHRAARRACAGAGVDERGTKRRPRTNLPRGPMPKGTRIASLIASA